MINGKEKWREIYSINNSSKFRRSSSTFRFKFPAISEFSSSYLDFLVKRYEVLSNEIERKYYRFYSRHRLVNRCWTCKFPLLFCCLSLSISTSFSFNCFLEFLFRLVKEKSYVKFMWIKELMEENWCQDFSEKKYFIRARIYFKIQQNFFFQIRV